MGILYFIDEKLCLGLRQRRGNIVTRLQDICVYVCRCVCVCMTERNRQRERKGEGATILKHERWRAARDLERAKRTRVFRCDAWKENVRWPTSHHPGTVVTGAQHPVSLVVPCLSCATLLGSVFRHRQRWQPIMWKLIPASVAWVVYTG